MKYMRIPINMRETVNQRVIRMSKGVWAVYDDGLKMTVVEGTEKECKDYVGPSEWLSLVNSFVGV